MKLIVLHGYYECHHIKPRSLGGADDKNNIVKLTAREHFICHWLLVKMFDTGTVERKKMLHALWCMRRQPTKDNQRYLNARAYEKLRIEYAQHISEMNKFFGDANGMYGLHWYTNIDNGKSVCAKEKPSERYIEGKNVLNGQNSSIKAHITHDIMQMYVRQLWNEYHASNYTSISVFGNIKNVIELRRKFRRYIPYFSKLSQNTKHGRFKFLPDKKLINKFD